MTGDDNMGVFLSKVTNALGQVGEGIKQVASPVVDSAEQWMRDRADEARGGLSQGYHDIMDTGIKAIQDISPDFAKGAIGSMGAGYAAIGSRVLDFLDPVSYGLELGADLIGNMRNGPKRNIDAIKMMADGNWEGGLTSLGKNFADETLLKAQIAAMVIPGGHIAGKAAKAPLKVARKELKQAAKTVPKGSVEQKAIKHDLRVNRLKSTVGVSMAKNMGRVSKVAVRSNLDHTRRELGVKQRTKFTPLARDWDSLTKDLDPSSPLMKEGDALWQKQTRKNSKRK